jgi:phosphodiesterase/alkaline phosphatase D-like protein
VRAHFGSQAFTANPVVITGDLHSYVAAELKVDYGNVDPFDLDNYVGVEFMTSSVTSAALFDTLLQDVQGDPVLVKGLTAAAVTLTNPHRTSNTSRARAAAIRCCVSRAATASGSRTASTKMPIPPRRRARTWRACGSTRGCRRWYRCLPERHALKA